MKTLQNYIKEEIKKFEKIFGGKEHRLWLENTEMRAETDCEEELEHFFRQSLQRIAKITAEEIVPDKRISYVKERDKISFDEFIIYNDGYLKCWLALQTKIKEFGI